MKHEAEKILIDSCVYFRLARYIPVDLLGTEFGDEKYCLYAVSGFEQEFLNSPRLQAKFSWASDRQYVNNRESFPINISRKQEKQIESTTVDILELAGEKEYKGFSETDADALSTAEVLGIKVVTDDTDMLKMARYLDIDAMKTLDLLKLMVDTGYISEQDAHDIVAAWKYHSDDLPGGCVKDYLRIFGKEMP